MKKHCQSQDFSFWPFKDLHLQEVIFTEVRERGPTDSAPEPGDDDNEAVGNDFMGFIKGRFNTFTGSRHWYVFKRLLLRQLMQGQFLDC